METAAANFFASILSSDGWKAIPTEIAKQIETITEEKFAELLTEKAISETRRVNAGKRQNFVPCG